VSGERLDADIGVMEGMQVAGRYSGMPDVRPQVLSIVIANWNGADLLPACLEPLADSGYEVIVVDNGSTDGSCALLRESFPWVRLVENRDNLGFSKANNQGIAIATGHYLLLLNNDTYGNQGTLRDLVAFMDSHPKAGIVGPSLTNSDGTPQESCGPGPNLWTEFLRRTLLHRLFRGVRARAPSKICQVDWVTGAALFIRRDLALSLGGLDEGMFMYYEDLDLCARARQAAYEVWFLPTTPIVHLGGGTRQRALAASLMHSYQSTDRFFVRNGPRWRRELLRAATVPEMLLRGGLWLALGLKTGRRDQARERLRAYRSILRLVVRDFARG
jgi:GT2 family glycosyltransferase